MDRINHQADKRIDELQYVAVVIGEPSLDQRHTGVAFRVDEAGPIQLLHLAWHCQLKMQPRVGSKYCWIEPAIHPLRLKQLAAICEDVFRANFVEQIPYSFGPPTAAFDERTCKFLLGPTTTGLTCASFVLALFERAQLRLARYSGWPPPDDDDVRWQESVVESLKRTIGVAQAHIDAVEKEVGTSVRYRPEQVAGAAAIRNLRAVKYKYAKSLGNDVVRFLRRESGENEFKLSLFDRVLRKLGFF